MIKEFLHEFKEFAVKGNVIDMAIGIIIGGAFSPIVNSLVKDIIMPPIGFVLGNVDFSNLYIPLTKSEQTYSTIAEAQDAGIVTINYGIFINTLISFLIVAFAVFLLVKFINKLKLDKKEETCKVVETTTKECPYCCSVINIKAKKCAFCGSELQ
ncbi:MAG: large conductance mechanosensitive channel protein MscL [Candidatus Gastranaerophilales bacterium]|nr:large conductance mechanosensitive channel protein MscL [Candidatus Gastranaerophilales bacterium]